MTNRINAVLPFCIGDQELELHVTAAFTKGSPAYTPRGEYAPIDPPEPDEYDIESVTVVENGKYLKVPDWLFRAVARDLDDGGPVREKLEEITQWE